MKIYLIVRLSQNELIAIEQSFLEVFLPEDHIWIFGSRADKNKKGGDIDLYIETTIADFEDVRKREDKLVFALWQKIGEQRIDVVVNMLKESKQLPIYTIARDTGVQLK